MRIWVDPWFMRSKFFGRVHQGGWNAECSEDPPWANSWFLMIPRLWVLLVLRWRHSICNTLGPAPPACSTNFSVASAHSIPRKRRDIHLRLLRIWPAPGATHDVHTCTSTQRWPLFPVVLHHLANACNIFSMTLMDSSSCCPESAAKANHIGWRIRVDRCVALWRCLSLQLRVCTSSRRGGAQAAGGAQLVVLQMCWAGSVVVVLWSGCGARGTTFTGSENNAPLCAAAKILCMYPVNGAPQRYTGPFFVYLVLAVIEVRGSFRSSPSPAAKRVFLKARSTRTMDTIGRRSSFSRLFLGVVLLSSNSPAASAVVSMESFESGHHGNMEDGLGSVTKKWCEVGQLLPQKMNGDLSSEWSTEYVIEPPYGCECPSIKSR